MPSAEEQLIGDFDDFQNHHLQPELEQVENFQWPAPTKKKKKKAKKDAAQTRARLEEEEDTPYPKSVTPSPPTQHGVKLESPPPPPPVSVTEPEPEPELPPGLDEPSLAAWDDDTTAVDEPEPEPVPAPSPKPAAVIRSLPVRSPQPRSAKPYIPATSPPATSPRPAAARLASPTTSPRPAPAKPATYAQRPNSLYGPPQQYGSVGSYRANGANGMPAPAPQRRESFATQQRSPQPRPAQPSFVDPPPPHMPQPHFFGLPDLGFNFGAKAEQGGKAAGSDGYCCVFDSFADAGDSATAKKAKDALLVGMEGCLDVFKVLPERIEMCGRLEGLRGAVIDAKILPHTELYDPAQNLRPLVAVTVHGPAVINQVDARLGGEEADSISDDYQTSVEVYSLQLQLHVATLYRSTTVTMEKPVVGHLSLPPKPVGDLRLDAKGRFVTLSSGKSGEVWVFSCSAGPDKDELRFRCIAKCWTALQQRQEAMRPASSGEGIAASDDQKQDSAPLMSLSSRWLAVVPPYTSASISIQGQPTVSDIDLPPYGFNTHVAPAQPPLTCEVAGLDAEGTLSWLSRKAASGLVAATAKGYEMSQRGWKELTHPSPPSERGQQNHGRSASDGTALFPPTNAPMDDGKRLAKEPALVSILDLEKLRIAAEQNAKVQPAPLATFALVEGCNHLSFSPDGLRLLTSNRRGEVSTIWDLSHLSHGRAKVSKEEDAAELERGPHVKIVHRVARSSPSTIVDSIWSRDGDWLALLTTHGTVHLHEIPLTPSRKRKRQSTISAPAPAEKADATVGLSSGASPPSSNTATGGWMGGLRSWSQSISTQVNTIKSQYAPATSFAGFKETAAAARTAGQRAVAKGLSQGYTAAKSGVGDMWHSEDNKIRVKGFSEAVQPRPRCLTWVQRQSGTILAVVAGGMGGLHPVQRVMRRKGDVMVSGLKKEKGSKSFGLPSIGTSSGGKTDKKRSSCALQGPHGWWGPRFSATKDDPLKQRRRASSAAKAPSANVANEVETNPPYCPFHVDSRISIYAFEDSGYGSQAALHGHTTKDALFNFKTRGHGHAEQEEPWVFGEPLPPSMKMNSHDVLPRNPHAYGSDDEDDDGLVGQVQSKLTVTGDDEGQQEITVNSRRSRRAPGADEDHGGFGMLEDDDSLM